MAKIKVYECVGTDVAASITGQMQTYTYEQLLASNQLATGLDPDSFEHVFIQGYMNQIKPLQPSVDKGVQIVTQNINANSGQFALVGTSQGAMIMSLIFKKLMSGEINRLSDCVGVFLLGNPLRQAGRAFPGATSIPPGHGIAPASMRLTNTTSLVWEFANPGDPVCTNGDDLVSQAREGAFMNLLTSWDGKLDSLDDVVAIANDIVNFFSFTVTTGVGMALYHNVYGQANYYPIAGDSRNAFQIIIDQLNTKIAPVYRSDGWSTTLKLPTS